MEYRVNIIGPTGIVNATIYKNEPIFRSRACQSVLILIESIKTTSMEDVSTKVLEKIKNI